MALLFLITRTMFIRLCLYRGRRYGVKLWEYPQISLAPLLLVVILDLEIGSKRFLKNIHFWWFAHLKPNIGGKLPIIRYLINYKVIYS